MNFSEFPKFSIVIPCFNQSEYLDDCFHSLFQQKFEAWEAILVNDGSSDETDSIGRNLAKRDSRILYIEQENLGLSAARNVGIKIAKGEFLLFLDSDDWLEPNCLKSYADVIPSNPEIKLFRCGYVYKDKPSGRRFHSHLPSSNGDTYPGVLTQNIGPCHSILIRRSFVEKLGGFDQSLKSCEDWDFWIRAGKMGARIQSISKVLVGYRYLPNSMSRNPRVMYDSLSEVSRRAVAFDLRLPEEAPKNQEYNLDFPEIQKNHLIRMLGVMIHQGKVEKSIIWYQEEQKKWNWRVEKKDWKYLSTYLSWGYFFEPVEIKHLLQKTKKDLNLFFIGLGYTDSEANEIIRMVFEPQLKRRNHQRFGKYFGALLNRLEFY